MLALRIPANNLARRWLVLIELAHANRRCTSSASGDASAPVTRGSLLSLLVEAGVAS
jgi:hypothetical protein